jgi:hypothetical protein
MQPHGGDAFHVLVASALELSAEDVRIQLFVKPLFAGIVQQRTNVVKEPVLPACNGDPGVQQQAAARMQARLRARANRAPLPLKSRYVKGRTYPVGKAVHTGTRGGHRAHLHERIIMTTRLPDASLNTRVEREVERERHERLLHDEQRAGIAADEEFRIKDAREQRGAVSLKRPPVR